MLRAEVSAEKRHPAVPGGWDPHAGRGRGLRLEPARAGWCTGVRYQPRPGPVPMSSPVAPPPPQCPLQWPSMGTGVGLTYNPSRGRAVRERRVPDTCGFASWRSAHMPRGERGRAPPAPGRLPRRERGE